MNRFEVLGFGTQLILDGFQADPARLTDPQLLEQVLRDLGSLLDRGSTSETALVRIEGQVVGGYSIGAVEDEAQVSIHTFPSIRKLSMAAFSTHDMPVDAATSVFRHRFAVGRYESRVHGRARLLPTDPDRLRIVITGDREYTRLRLRDVLSTAS